MQLRTPHKGRQYRTSAKEAGLAHAKAFAEDRYFALRGKQAAGLIKTETTFAEATKKCQQEDAIISEGERKRTDNAH